MNTTLYCFSLISTFLIIGTILRARVPLFQKTFLPASVIGGILGLLLTPTVLGNFALLRLPDEWMKILSMLPGVLIVPIVASVPLGMKFGGGKKGDKNPMITFLILGLVGAFQILVGLCSNLFFNDRLYKGFSIEMIGGFSGGHGTAGLIGRLLRDSGIPHWETAQGVTITFATIGLLTGIIFGIFYINVASRRGETSFLKKPSDIPMDIKLGYISDIEKQESIGRETTHSSSIDTFALHTAIILSVSGGSFLLINILKKYNVLILSKISAWAYAILLMFLVWHIMCKLNLEWIIDSKVKSKVSGTLTEFAITAAIISLPIKAVLTYIVPILIITVIGIIGTILVTRYLCYKFFDNFKFERAISIIGTSTGVFLTGLLLLRICDPEFKSPVLKDFSIAYSLNTFISLSFMTISMDLAVKGLLMKSIYFNAGIAILYTIILVVLLKTKISTASEVKI